MIGVLVIPGALVLGLVGYLVFRKKRR